MTDDLLIVKWSRFKWCQIGISSGECIYSVNFSFRLTLVILMNVEELIDQIIEATKRDQERALHMVEEAIKYAHNKDLVN